MPASLPSSKFKAVYDTLPLDARHYLVEQHLIPLLDSVPKDKSRRVLGEAARLRKRHTGISTLDIRAKRNEIDGLLNDLRKDSKRTYIQDHSNKDELYIELINSLTDWLNDIWRLVFEHNVDFVQAHSCLLFIWTSMDNIDNIRIGCKCRFTSMQIPVTLRNKHGAKVKSFDIRGGHKLDEVLHFIWRELFLSILAFGPEVRKNAIPDMLRDIEELMGWSALERIFYGGKKCHSSFDDDTDTEEDTDSDDYEDPSTDDDESYEDLQPFHCRHWPNRVGSQMSRLRQLIQDTMMSVFEVNPSPVLFSSLMTLSPDPATTETALLKSLNTIATSSPDALSAALNIHSLECNPKTIVSLLNSHGHLLRPRDAPSLQAAALVLSHNGFSARALQVLEKELIDTARAIRTVIFTCFCRIDDSANKDELTQIVRLPHGTATRQDRVEHWVDAVATPGTNQPNPMAFAAMMIGLPILPGMDPNDETDSMGYLDLNPDDPDLEELRELYRPRLKQRLETWADTGESMRGGPAVLSKVYKEIIELMPFLRALDAVDEMIGRLADKPSKHYICDALEALSAFAKTQRRRASIRKSDKRRAHNFPPPLPHTSVDLDDDGPPPLEPIASSSEPSQYPSPLEPFKGHSTTDHRHRHNEDDDIPPLEPINGAPSFTSQTSEDVEDGPPPLEPIPSGSVAAADGLSALAPIPSTSTRNSVPTTSTSDYPFSFYHPMGSSATDNLRQGSQGGLEDVD